MNHMLTNASRTRPPRNAHRYRTSMACFNAPAIYLAHARRRDDFARSLSPLLCVN